jgi:hypothetical protein
LHNFTNIWFWCFATIKKNEIPIVEKLQFKVYELVVKAVKDHHGLAVTT